MTKLDSLPVEPNLKRIYVGTMQETKQRFFYVPECATGELALAQIQYLLQVEITSGISGELQSGTKVSTLFGYRLSDKEEICVLIEQ